MRAPHAAIATLTLLSACGAKTGLDVPPCDPDAGACCTPAPERCNGEDDDCDGAIDDGLACFFLDGEPIDALATERCGAAWYAYDSPDAQSANPTPDIRVSNEVVVAVQGGPTCRGASLAIIADLPDDGSGGQLDALFTLAPASAADILVSDEARECVHDAATGRGSCHWVWQPCCTDGVLIGALTADACIDLTLSAPLGVTRLTVLDGEARSVERTFGRSMQICAQIRPAVP